MSTPIITDELIETLKGIKDGKEYEFQLPCGKWEGARPNPNANIWVALLNGYPIRLKPFVPTPPEGYRLLTDEEKDGRFSGQNILLWKSCANLWELGMYAADSKKCHYAVPIAPPEPEYAPWSFETRPKEMVWVYKKGYITDRLITGWRDDSVEIAGIFVNYATLFSDWLQRDGTPCGELKK